MKRSLSMRQNFEITISVFDAVTFRLSLNLDPDSIRKVCNAAMRIFQKLPWYILFFHIVYQGVIQAVKTAI